MAQAQPVATQPPISNRRYVFNLALPAVGEQMLNMAVGLADVFLLGNLTLAAAEQLGYGRVEAVAGVGLGNQMVWLVTVMFMSVGIGSTAMIARARGAGDEARVQRILRQSLLLGVTVGLIGTLVLLLLSQPFLWLLDAPPDAFPRAMEYLLVITTTVLPAALLFVGTACLRGVGDTRTPLYVMLGANAINVLLTWLLVSGNLGLPALGVVGAAIGTAVARGGGGIVVVGLLIHGRSGLKLELANLRPDWDMLRRLVHIGVPSAGEMFVFHTALLFFTRYINTIGTVAYSAHFATINIESVSFLPGMGYGFAASTLVGQALGARRPDQAEAHAYEALWQGMAMMTVGGVVMVLFPAALMGFFVNDPAAVAVGTAPLLAAGLMQPCLAIGFILNGALRGAGDTKWPMYSRMITAWGIRIPLGWLLVVHLDMGLNGAWLTMCIDFAAQAMLAMWRFASGRWKTVEV